MQIAYPFTQHYRITDDFAAHLARNSTAPGIDFAAPMKTPIYAPFHGKIVTAKTYTLGGRTLWLSDTDQPGIKVYYAHLNCVCALPGEIILPGQLIAYTGRTGNATGPCLHLSLQIDGAYTDPGPYLDPAPGRQPEPAAEQETADLPLSWSHTVPVDGRIEMALDDSEQNIIIEARAAAGDYGTLEPAVREPAYRFLQVPRNEGAALLKYARAQDLGAAITPEFYVSVNDITYCCQGYAQALVYCVKGDWANIQAMQW